MPDDNRMSYTVMYSDDGRNFKELKSGWFYILTKDCDCPEAQVTVIPPDRREVKDGDKLPKNLDAVFPEVASEEQQKAPLFTKLARAWKKRAS